MATDNEGHGIDTVVYTFFMQTIRCKDQLALCFEIVGQALKGELDLAKQGLSALYDMSSSNIINNRTEFFAMFALGSFVSLVTRKGFRQKHVLRFQDYCEEMNAIDQVDEPLSHKWVSKLIATFRYAAKAFFFTVGAWIKEIFRIPVSIAAFFNDILPRHIHSATTGAASIFFASSQPEPVAVCAQ